MHRRDKQKVVLMPSIQRPPEIIWSDKVGSLQPGRWHTMGTVQQLRGCWKGLTGVGLH